MMDIVLLIFLKEIMGLSLPIATSIAYWTSIGYNFCLNRWWTFSANEEKQLHEHAALYLVLLGFNYLFTVIFVSMVGQIIYYGLAKIIATGIQISWTYPTYKYLIFKQTERADP